MPIELEEVMGTSPDLPLCRHVLLAPEEDLPQSSGLFDLAEDGFNGGLSPGVDRVALFCRKLSPHALLGRQILSGAAPYSAEAFAVLEFSCGKVGVEQCLLKEHHVVFREVSCISAHGFKFMVDDRC
jgi:hypothetical protein